MASRLPAGRPASQRGAAATSLGGTAGGTPCAAGTTSRSRGDKHGSRAQQEARGKEEGWDA